MYYYYLVDIFPAILTNAYLLNKRVEPFGVIPSGKNLMRQCNIVFRNLEILYTL